MHALLEEAIEADDAARWWWRVEESKRNSAWFMVQSVFRLSLVSARLTRYGFLAFPQRAYTLTYTIIASLRKRNIPISLSLFSPSSFRQLFPPSTRPSELITSVFPHLSNRSHVLARSLLHLSRDECKDKRKQLEQPRNERAANLGRFAVASQALEADLTSGKIDLSSALQEFEALGASMSLREGSPQCLNGALESIALYQHSHTISLAALQAHPASGGDRSSSHQSPTLRSVGHGPPVKPSRKTFRRDLTLPVLSISHGWSNLSGQSWLRSAQEAMMA